MKQQEIESEKVEKVKQYLEKINELRKRKFMEYKAILDRMEELEKGIRDARKALENTASPMDIQKYGSIIKSYSTEKQLLMGRLKIIEGLHKDESRLEKELEKLGYEYV